MALREEEANKITFTNDFSKRTKCKERNQYQQPNHAGCDQLIESSTADRSEGIDDATAMNEPHYDLFKGIQNE